MSAREDGIPVYIICGFLDSGKTRFINEMLGDPGFSEGERTLLLRCEEGMEEYDPELVKESNAVVIDLEDVDDMNARLNELDGEYLPERVIFEYNSTWMLNALYNAPKPEFWELAQIVTLVDSNTFDMYVNNMRNFMTDGLMEADLVLFNRCDANTPKSRLRRTVLALNNTARIYFDNLDGTTDDGVSDEDLPWDMTRSPIEIPDEMFGIWYLDAMEHPDRYDGKLVKVKGQVAYAKGMPNKCYVLSRRAMTCCAEDISGIGYVCQTNIPIPKNGAYITATCKVEKAYSPIHGREAIILIEQNRVAAPKPKDEIVTFN